MSDALMVLVADAVVAQLNSREWQPAFIAVRAYRPPVTLQRFSGFRVMVIPREDNAEMILRSKLSDEEILVDVGVQAKVRNTENQTLDPLMRLCDEIKEFFLGLTFGDPPATVLQTTIVAWVPEHLDKFNVFTSVVTLHCGVAR